MLHVNCPLVAVLADDAWQHLVERVATLVATGLKVGAVAGDHGSALHGFGVHTVPTPLNTGSFGLPIITDEHAPTPVFSSTEQVNPHAHSPPRWSHSALGPPLHRGRFIPSTVIVSGPQHDPLVHWHWHCGLTVQVVPSQHAPSLQA